MADLEERFIPAFYQMICEDDDDMIWGDGSIVMCEYPNPVNYPAA